MKLKKQQKPKSISKNQSLYGAVDLHGDNGFYGIIDEQDRHVYGRRLPNDLKVVLPELAP